MQNGLKDIFDNEQWKGQNQKIHPTFFKCMGNRFNKCPPTAYSYTCYNLFLRKWSHLWKLNKNNAICPNWQYNMINMTKKAMPSFPSEKWILFWSQTFIESRSLTKTQNIVWFTFYLLIKRFNKIRINRNHKKMMHENVSVWNVY